MATSILNFSDIIHVDSVDVLATDKSLLVCVPLNGNNANSEAVYRKTTGDPGTPLSIRVGSYPNPAANAGVGLVNTSIKVSSFVTKTDTDGDVVWTLPCTLTLAWSMPGASGVPDKAGLQAMIGTAVSFALPVTDGVVNPDAMSRLAFSIVTDLEQFSDTASV